VHRGAFILILVVWRSVVDVDFDGDGDVEMDVRHADREHEADADLTVRRLCAAD
jgi:hypothetical protein